MHHSRIWIFTFFIIAGYCFATPSLAQQPTGIHGTVKGNGNPIVGATVRILELDRIAHTDAKGEFSFLNVSNGKYSVFVRVIGYAAATNIVEVANAFAETSFMLQESVIRANEVVVSASPYARTENDQYQSAASKSKIELHDESGSSFTEQISDLPGVDVRYNGAAATRPILRGLSNNEVLVLENGLRTGDIATFDPAHATPIEEEAVQEVDIVRGPASILFGPNAIGGLVNVITNTIPWASTTPVTGDLSVVGNSVNDLYSGHFNAVYSDGSSAFSISAGGLHSDAIQIPSGTYSDPNANNQTFKLDTMPQSFMRTAEEGIGYSYTGNFGMIGVGVKHYTSDYGIPGDPVDTSQTNPGPTSSRIEQDKYTVELRALFEVDGSFINQVRFNGNTTDYNHSEFPVVLQPNFQVTDSAQNHFHQNGYNAVLQFIEQRMGNFQGTIGLFSNLDNLTIDGQQPLGPNSLTTDLAGYIFEEYLAGENTRVQGAIRYDYNKIQTSPAPNSQNPLFTTLDTTRLANAFTGSLGIVQKLTSSLTGSINIGRSYRAPTVQELFAYGADAASGAFLIGDSKIVPETGIGFDASIKGQFSWMSFEISPYLNLLTNYIYSYNTGQTDSLSQFPVRQFAQTDARLYGLEVTTTFQLVQNLALTANASYINASAVRDSVVPLPSTPPLKGLLRLNYLDETYAGMIEWRLVDKERRLGDGDFYTAGYGVVNLGFGVRLYSGRVVHNISVHCDNLLDQKYFSNLSAVGFFMPQPARGFRLTYDAIF